MYRKLARLLIALHDLPVRLWLLAVLSLGALAGCSDGERPYESDEYALQGLYSAEFSSDGKQAIVGSINHGGSLWQFDSNKRKYNWNHRQGEYSQIIAAAISDDSNYAMTATPQTMVLWDMNSGQGLSYWSAPSEILDVALLPGGQLALLGLVDHSAALFDIQNGGVRQVFYHDGRVTSVDYHAASNTIVTGAEDYSARLWNAQTGEELQRWDHRDEVQLVRFSPDGQLVFSMAKYDKAIIWNTADGTKVSELPLSASAIRRGKFFTAATFSPDSRYLLTGTADRIVQLWEITRMQPLKRWKMPRRHAASPTGAAVLALTFAEAVDFAQGDYYAMTSDGFAHRLR